VLEWKFEAGGAVQASPAIAGGVIVFGANDHRLYALDRFTGRTLWKFRTSRAFVQAPPVIHGDYVFAAGWSDWVWCLELASGEPVWKAFIPVSIEAVSVFDERLWVRSPYWVVELDTGSGKWLHIAEASYGYGGLAFIGDQLFQSGVLGQHGTFGATSIAMNAEGGPPPEQVAPTLEGVKMLSPEFLLDSSDPGSTETMISARMSKGMLTTQGSLKLASMAAPLALGNEMLCFATLSGEVTLTGLDGKTLWKYQLGGTCHGIPVAAGGMLVVGGDDGYLYAFREARRK
jgi:hypothetical protein